MINTLWTGGMDSTFRILQLSKYDVVVQPIYILDENRKSVKQELESINIISEKIMSLSDTRFLLKELVIINKSDILQEEEISNAFRNINFSMGSQYEWLANFASNFKNLELGLIKRQGSLMERILSSGGKIQLFPPDSVSPTEYYKLDPQESSRDLLLLFGNYIFPVYFSKNEILNKYKELDGLEIFRLTWFCHSPRKGKPCGLCVPCSDALENGMGFRIPLSSRIRGRLVNTLRLIKRFIKGLR